MVAAFSRFWYEGCPTSQLWTGGPFSLLQPRVGVVVAHVCLSSVSVPRARVCLSLFGGASSEVRRCCNSSVVVQMRWMRASFLPEIYLSTTVPSIARACSKEAPLHHQRPGKDSHAARVRGAGGE